MLLSFSAQTLFQIFIETFAQGNRIDDFNRIQKLLGQKESAAFGCAYTGCEESVRIERMRISGPKISII
jgi:hypothetical protein